MLSFVISFILTIVVLLVCVYLFDKFILPLIPQTWIKWIVGLGALLLILWLIQTFVRF